MKFHRIVVLIDADNTNLANLEKLIEALIDLSPAKDPGTEGETK